HVETRLPIAHDPAAALESLQHPKELARGAPDALGDLVLREPPALLGEQFEHVEGLIERRYRVVGAGASHQRFAPMAASMRRAITRLMSSGTGSAPCANSSAA